VKLLTLSPDVQEEFFYNKDKKKRRNFLEIFLLKEHKLYMNDALMVLYYYGIICDTCNGSKEAECSTYLNKEQI
jgi:hypothetical protein